MLTQGAFRGAGRCRGRRRAGSGREVALAAAGRQAAELRADLVGGGVTHAVHLVRRRGAGLHRTRSSEAELAQRFDRARRRLWGPRSRRRRARLGRPSPRRWDRTCPCGAGVVTVGLVHLDHVQPSSPQVPAEPSTPRRGAFDTDREDFTEARHTSRSAPDSRASWSGTLAVSSFRPSSSSTTTTWNVLVRVDPGDDTPVVVCDGGHAAPFLLVGWHARPGGWTRQGAGLVAQAPLRSRSPDRLCHDRLRSSDRQVSSRTPEGSSRSVSQTQ